MGADCPQFNGHAGRDAFTVRTKDFRRIGPMPLSAPQNVFRSALVRRTLALTNVS
jgi:hypothetical protein